MALRRSVSLKLGLFKHLQKARCVKVVTWILVLDAEENDFLYVILSQWYRLKRETKRKTNSGEVQVVKQNK